MFEDIVKGILDLDSVLNLPARGSSAQLNHT